MTNDQYEKDSVMRGLQRHDQVIHSLDEALRVANESRREYVNRYNLNKVGSCEGCQCTEPDQHMNLCD